MLTSEGRRSIKAPFTSARNLKYARIYKCTQRVCFYKTNPRLVRLDDADVATQLKFGLPADPYPTAELLARMRSGHGDKSRRFGRDHDVQRTTVVVDEAHGLVLHDGRLRQPNRGRRPVSG